MGSRKYYKIEVIVSDVFGSELDTDTVSTEVLRSLESLTVHGGVSVYEVRHYGD